MSRTNQHFDCPCLGKSRLQCIIPAAEEDYINVALGPMCYHGVMGPLIQNLEICCGVRRFNL